MTNDAHANADANVNFWRQLLRRWLVEYNPLYLLSASLCLAGMIMCSRGLAREGSPHGELVVALIAEVYAGALIGGAALLTRIGQRRPAVMLALITALYQCDLTLHTEACAYLGTVGVLATAAWAALFVAKLYALAWAVRLRLSISAAATATHGALGIAILPHYVGDLGSRGASALVAFWLFTLFALGLHGARTITSTVELDVWGRTVLRRALRAVWVLWSLLLVLHVGFWSLNRPIQVSALIPVALLLSTRRVRREAHVWCVAAGTSMLVAVAMPQHFAITALMTATALVLRAFWRPAEALPMEHESVRSPYRALDSDLPPIAPVAPVSDVAAMAPTARRRLLTGALFGVYLAVWTLAWAGGPWPAHILALDLVLSGAVILAAFKARVRIALAPLGATFAHFAVQARAISAPTSTLEWGAASVGLGFVLLIASLGASYFLRNVETNG